MIQSIEWTGRNLKIIDQTEIPNQLSYIELNAVEEVFEAIQKLRVRGAPAIGITAAYGLYLGMHEKSFVDRTDFFNQVNSLAKYLGEARPTAVNLEWALRNIIERLENLDKTPQHLREEILVLAREIQRDDEDRCQKISQYGAGLIHAGMAILTHCNTGALATAGLGTALGAIYTAFHQGKKIEVLVDETRPLLQGARLTMWELEQAGIPATLFSDNMAAYAMQKGKVDLVIIGADRIAANGDVANKIGTYSLAVNCKYHKIPFYVAAPLSSFDFSLSSGQQIPIEERDSEEVRKIWNKLEIAPKGTKCWNPAFDITPSELISGIVTEAGIVYPPFEKALENIKLSQNIYQNQEEINP